MTQLITLLDRMLFGISTYTCSYHCKGVLSSKARNASVSSTLTPKDVRGKFVVAYSVMAQIILREPRELTHSMLLLGKGPSQKLVSSRSVRLKPHIQGRLLSSLTGLFSFPFTSASAYSPMVPSYPTNTPAQGDFTLRKSRRDQCVHVVSVLPRGAVTSCLVRRPRRCQVKTLLTDNFVETTPTLATERSEQMSISSQKPLLMSAIGPVVHGRNSRSLGLTLPLLDSGELPFYGFNSKLYKRAIYMHVVDIDSATGTAFLLGKRKRRLQDLDTQLIDDQASYPHRITANFRRMPRNSMSKTQHVESS